MMNHSNGLLYACMPCYGNGNRAALKQFWAKSVDPKGPYAELPSVYDDSGSSLLADSFNAHWKTALNLQLNGQNVTRFVMLHSDVVPQDFWVDVLLSELDRTGADVVSAVVPIKDVRGLTSTALDDPSDPWSVYRRLSLKEMETLPLTFSAEDCAAVGLANNPLSVLGIPVKHQKGLNIQYRPLLVNTGCWACRFDRRWRYHVHFEITNRMSFMRAGSRQVVSAAYYKEGDKGTFISQVMSEDWNFSRQLAILGCTVLATRKVKLTHIGEAPYNNQDLGWGAWEHDEALEDKWLPEPLPGVRGWLTRDEGKFLAKLSEKKDVLEIGSYCGRSTIYMARTAKRVYCIDTFESTGTYVGDKDGHQANTLNEFRSNLEKYRVLSKVHIRKGDTRDKDDVRFLRDDLSPSNGVDIIFIDGSHDKDSVENDVKVSLPLLREKGLVAFHDYQARSDEGVTEVVDSLISKGWKKMAVVDTVIVLSPHPSVFTDKHRYIDDDGESSGVRIEHKEPLVLSEPPLNIDDPQYYFYQREGTCHSTTNTHAISLRDEAVKESAK